ILFVLNYNDELTEDDRALFQAIEGFEYIVIINKTELEQKLNINEVKQLAGGNPIVTTSIIEEKGIDELYTAIARIFCAGENETGDLTYVSNVRHIQLLKQSKQSLEDAMVGLELGMPLDIVQIDVTRTWESLGEIVGDTASEGLIDQLFSQFCLGK